MTILDVINRASVQLSAAGIAEARRDAEVLFCNAAGRDRGWLLAHIREEADGKTLLKFDQAVDRRARREPLQYVTGSQEFWGLDFTVTPDVLIPRPETELIVESVLSATKDRNSPLTIIDLCTGSGCIAVSLAKELPLAALVATDLSPKALAIAQNNADRHAVSARIRFLQGDLLEPLETLGIRGEVDVITANPPYIAEADRTALQPEVRDYEPETALFAGPAGTEIHRRIIAGAPGFLRSGALLIMEMGIGQAAELRTVIKQSGFFEDVEVLKDLAGIDRVIVMQRK